MSDVDRRKKITDAQVRGLRALWLTGHWTQASLAREFGISQPAVSLIVRGRSR